MQITFIEILLLISLLIQYILLIFLFYYLTFSVTHNPLCVSYTVEFRVEANIGSDAALCGR